MDFEVPVKRLVKRPTGGAPSLALKSSGNHRRSKPPPITVALKIGWRLLQRPDYIRCFVEFQGEKELFNVLYRKQHEGRANKMRQLSFRITDVCNLRCHTCCQWGDNGYLLDRKLSDLYKQEVSSERYIEILREIKANGHTPLLYFWGGEPTMYKGLCDVIDEGARLGMAPTLVTNGLNIPAMSERMVDAPLAFIQLSLDGPTKEIHNGARPGANDKHDNFQDVVDSIDTLYEVRERKGKKLPIIGTYTTVSSFNQHRLVEIYERFKEKVDLFIFTLAWWIDEKSSEAHEADFESRFGFQPTLHRGFQGSWHDLDVHALSKELKELERRSKLPGGKAVYIQPRIMEPEQLTSFFNDHNETFGYDQCISIFQNPELDSNGNLSPCRDYHDYVIGNVKDQSLVELWNSPKYVEFRQNIRQNGLMPVCARCCGLMGY